MLIKTGQITKVAKRTRGRTPASKASSLKTAQKNAEKGSTFVLRNWSYFGLKEKIKYKAALFGIKFISDKEKPTKEDEEMESIMLENG